MSPGPWHDKMFWGILVGSFIIRMLAIETVHKFGYTGDEREYVSLAKGLESGNDFVDSNGERSTRSPLFPFVLAGLFSLAGEGLFLPHFMVCVLGSAVVALGYVLCRKLLLDRSVSMWASIIMGTYPGLVVYSALLQTESLFTVFFLGATIVGYALVDHPTINRGMLLGVLSGLAALTRSVFLGVFPVILVSCLILARKGGRRVHWCALASVLAFVVVLLPWTVRNYRVHGILVPVSLWGGQSLLIANNPYATGTWSVKEGFEEWFSDQLRSRGIPDRSSLSEGQLSAMSREIALAYMTGHPGETAILTLKKAHIFGVFPITHSDSYLPLQAVAVMADVLLLLGSVVGVVTAWNRRIHLMPLFGAMAVFAMTHSILSAEARYRLPIVPFLAILFALGIRELASKGGRMNILSTRGARVFLSMAIPSIILVYALTVWMVLAGHIPGWR